MKYKSSKIFLEKDQGGCSFKESRNVLKIGFFSDVLFKACQYRTFNIVFLFSFFFFFFGDTEQVLILLKSRGC